MEGGAGTFALQLLNLNKYLRNSSVQLAVLEKPTYRKVDENTNSVIYFRQTPYPNSYSLTPSTVLLLVNELLWLQNVYNDSNPDIVVAIDIHANYLALVLKLLTRKKAKVICTNHISVRLNAKHRLSLPLRFLASRTGHLLYPFADSIVGVSKGVSKEVKSYYNLDKHIETIYNGFTRKKSATATPKFISTKKKTKIITITRLESQKDLQTLIQAFYLLRREYPLCELVVLGDGPLRMELERTVANAGLTSAIHFVGWKNNPITILQQAAVFVLSTKREGFPYAILEAMAVGIPIIATDVPYGPREALDKGRYGILIPLGDAVALKDALSNLLTDNSLYQYYAAQASKRASFFSEEKMLTSYKDLIQALINKHHLDK